MAGRPYKAKNTKKTAQIGVRMTEQERKKIERAANRASLTFSEYIRFHVPELQ